jgi:putative membrane protein
MSNWHAARRAALCWAAAGFAASSSSAWSHTSVGVSDQSGFAALLEVGLPILLAAALYLVGTVRLLIRSGREHRRVTGRSICFSLGLIVLATALLSPLDRWGAQLFAAHMVQHEVLMLVAAPLLVLGNPLPAFLWAWPASVRAALGRMMRRAPVENTWSVLTAPLCAWLLHALALWIWHVPRFFDAVLVSRGVHDLQHITFVATALIFWSALLRERRREGQGAGVLYLFTTTVHTSVLGALITFATRPWYSSYLQTSPHWGLSALEDQQLGGLIMWVPASLIYVGVALVLMARWIEAEARPVP